MAASLVASSHYVSSGNVSAYILAPCQYGGAAVRSLIFKFDSSVSTNWRTNFTTAKDWWNSAVSSDVTLTIASPTSSTYNFIVKQINDPDAVSSSWADVGCPGGHPAASSYIQYNIAKISDNVDTFNKITANHELGHALGLAHTSANTSCSDQSLPNGQTYPNGTTPRSVMSLAGQTWAYNNCGGVLPPYADDIGGIRAAYTGGK